MLNQSFSIIYDTYFRNMSVLGSVPCASKQYHPHKCFVKFNSSFETSFLPLLASNDLQAVQALIKRERESISTFSIQYKSYKTYCIKFLDFLDTIISDRKYSSTLKNIQKAYCIDGIEALVESLGGEKKFIQKSIENSYFFVPDLVVLRFSEIDNLYRSLSPIPARWQGQRKSGIRPQSGYPQCDIDANGNAKTRSVIRNHTALTISGGKSSLFQNYKISHIWGNANDPRYFTNFWNLAFVPAWANGLLDDPNPLAGSMSSKMINTYMELCLRFYHMASLHWNNIGMQTPTVRNSSDIVHGTYNFKIISPQTSGYPMPFKNGIITI